MRIACAMLVAVLWAAPGAAQRVSSEILVHTGPTVGLAHHQAKQVWAQLQVGDAVALVREPDNAHDVNAVRVEWNGHVLGYLPRTDNEGIARQIDRGNRLAARIARLDRHRNHRLRLEVDIFMRF